MNLHAIKTCNKSLTILPSGFTAPKSTTKSEVFYYKIDILFKEHNFSFKHLWLTVFKDSDLNLTTNHLLVQFETSDHSPLNY